MESENAPSHFGNTETQQTLLVGLSEEIIEEVLARLPVKSLLKFRCVSKSWRSLIDSKRFIKAHLENSRKNAAFAHHRLIIKYAPLYHRLKHCSLPSFLNSPLANSFTFDDPISINSEGRVISLVGCCNGLVCILLSGIQFILWNPSTRMSKKLPDVHDEMKHLLVMMYGFGCDESSGDYKVFGIVKGSSVVGGHHQTIGQVYSLRTNSWKITNKALDADVYSFVGGGKFAGGKLHWVRYRSVVSFDLKSEVYGMVELPCYSEGRFVPSLGLLGEWLCVLCFRETYSDVWVMKQYGVKESWNRVATVPYPHDDPRGIAFPISFAIGPNGEILLIHGSSFLIYYPKDDGFQHPLKIKYDEFREADIYFESLVSLVPYGEQERQGNPQKQLHQR